MATPLAKIGVLSIGDMGMGIAKLLIANGFAVATNCKGRRYVQFVCIISERETKKKKREHRNRKRSRSC